jgi:hypothetical protein
MTAIPRELPGFNQTQNPNPKPEANSEIKLQITKRAVQRFEVLV